MSRWRAGYFREKRQIPQYQYPQFQNPFFNNGNSQSTAQSQSHSHGVDQFGTQDANALANAQGGSITCSW